MHLLLSTEDRHHDGIDQRSKEMQMNTVMVLGASGRLGTAAVSAEQVKAIRETEMARTAMWTEASIQR